MEGNEYAKRYEPNANNSDMFLVGGDEMRHSAIMPLVVFALSAGPLIAEPLEPWGTSGDWTILVDPDAGHGCLMEKVYDGEIRIRFGGVPSEKGAFVSAANKNWVNVAVGTRGTVKLIFDDSRFSGDVDFVEDGDWKGFYAFFNNPEVVTDIALRKTMKAVFSEDLEFEVGLSGTAMAVEALEKCQHEQPFP